MKRRNFLKNSANTFGLFCLSPGLFGAIRNPGQRREAYSSASTDQFMPDLIPVPDHPEEWPEFRESLSNWRTTTRRQLNYNDELYKNPNFKWVSSAYNCYFLMMYDELFYDQKNSDYQVDGFLDQAGKEFGRLDILVLWHAYPRIGLDDRNQFDFYRDMPGGLAGIRNVSDRCHQRGLKVFLNYNPWDTGTRRENDPDIDILAQMVEEINADGIFLDTLNRGSSEFREKLDRAKQGVVLESELALPVEDISTHHMSWAQWFEDKMPPGILRNKWFERHHMQHGISRWERNRIKELHTAWMNGSGIMIWENVFGQWVGWNDRDKSILRSMSLIQKRYAAIFSGEGWIPFVNECLVEIGYASCWQGDGVRLWTLVNRSEKSCYGEILALDQKTGERFFDLITGKEVDILEKNGKIVLYGKISPRGIGCIVAGKPENLGSDFQEFLSGQAEIFRKRSMGTGFPSREAKRTPVIHTKKFDKPLKGMVEIPSYKGNLEIDFRVREVGFYSSIDPYFVNCGAPRLHQNISFTQEVNLSGFLMDETPVTNAQFHQFIKETGYSPKEKLNFLKHWEKQEIPMGKQDHPVVYVCLDDARAYTSWAGKRLPTEFEWQFAGQGFEKSIYPWGKSFEPELCNHGQTGDTSPVKNFPNGKSVFRCYDLCGNTWEMTESEHSDGRTRFCILKGGSFYKAEGSEWYFDGGPQPLNFAAKQILIYPGIDRCATVGFRCVVDI